MITCLVVGSGKTHTFFGPDQVIYEDFFDKNNCPSSTGIVMRACLELLQAEKDLAVRGIRVTISAQFVEIYEEQVTDLLSATDGRYEFV